MPTEETTFAIAAPSIFDGQSCLRDHCMLVREGMITQLLPATERPRGIELQTFTNGTLAPGFIDLQVNGGGGVMLNNDTSGAALDRISQAHRAQGTTSLLPTMMSDTTEKQQSAVETVRAACTGGNPGIAGIHLEGPFFATGRRGAHPAQMIRHLQTADLEWLCSTGDLRVVLTLAPELTAPGQIRQLADAGVTVCAGHTDASYVQLRAAAAEGLQGVTHLFNAMRPLASREPGTVGAALDDDSLWVGVIADGHHVHPASIRIAHRAKPAGRMVLVSDAMATVGSDADEFELYGEKITLSEGRLVNGEGVLAGSAIGMVDAVRYAHTAVGLPLEECLRMASLYPATILGSQDSLGRIASGYRADLVHFDDHFIVHNTWLAGRHLSHT